MARPSEPTLGTPSPPDVELAGYFGMDPALLPFIPELFADFRELGSDPELVASWLADAGIGPGARVLDLACGKGAVAVAVAARTGGEVNGVDRVGAFVAEAARSAQGRGVAHLCRFTCGDLRHALDGASGYDAVLYVSVGDVLGDLGHAMASLRKAVRDGGLIVIDDAFRTGAPATGRGGAEPRGYGHLQTHEGTCGQLTSCGDPILREEIVGTADVRAQNERYTALLEERARRIRERHPELAGALDAYLEKERVESRYLETEVRCATWLIQKRSG